MDGVLVIDKPSGPTSHDVVARVRRALAFRKIGHTGTLDPLATGVLPLVFGRATRLARFMSQSDKTYDAEVRLGLSTDTYDTTGAPTVGGPGDAREPGAERVDLETDAIEHALDTFRGTYFQVPPPYSAKKVDGERAYRRARRGVRVTLQPVSVTVHRLELVCHVGDTVQLRVTCTAGFYLRTLAHDLGQMLGCGACLESLRRIESGGFTLSDVIPLGDVLRRPEEAPARVVPMRDLLQTMPAIVLSQQGTRRALHGHDIGPGDLESPCPAPDATGMASADTVRLLAGDGTLVAIAQPAETEGALHPMIVLGYDGGSSRETVCKYNGGWGQRQCRAVRLGRSWRRKRGTR